MLTIDDVAARFGVSRDIVSGWIASKELLAVSANQTRGMKRPTWRIRPEDLEAFELARRTLPPNPKSPRQNKPPRPPVRSYV